ncbi:MAG: DUF2530 domain-containing protein [Streptosporangiaceae bacterium]
MSRPERPVPPPLEGNDRLITAIITAGWAIALIVLLAVRDQLPPADRWWTWVAASGTLLGVFGLVYVPYLKRSRARAAERRSAAELERPAAERPTDDPARGGLARGQQEPGQPAERRP